MAYVSLVVEATSQGQVRILLSGSVDPAAKTYTTHSWVQAWQGLFDDSALRLAYADLLLRWGLTTARAELLLPIRGASLNELPGRDATHESLSEYSWESCV